jgi:hypothetical protein
MGMHGLYWSNSRQGQEAAPVAAPVDAVVNFMCHQMRGISGQAKDMFTYQHGLYSTVVVG